MKIALTGASGYVGSSVRHKLTDICDEFLILKRDDDIEIWRALIGKADVIINLAGYPILSKWNRVNREKILDSRIITTHKIVAILNEMPPEKSPKLFISASATRIYPENSSAILKEESDEESEGFLSEVVSKWEAEANDLINPEVRLIIMRLGLVLGKDTAMMRNLLPIFKLGLGGRMGNGKQLVTYIHIDDLINAIRFFIKTRETSGLYNMVSPLPITNLHFTKALAQALHRPAFMFIPFFMLKLIFGKASQVMIKGANVYPDHLVTQGFTYKYPTIEAAFNEICG